MKIASNAVVALDYTLTNDAGEVLDTSHNGEPLTYLHGQGQIVPGLETALEGCAEGDRFTTVVAPKDGYGERRAGAVVRVPRAELPDAGEPEVGMELEAVDDDGEPVTLWVVGVDDEAVSLSPEHPLAGVTLHFDVTVRKVRPATSEELAHGHSHGEDGHHHHH